MSSTRLAQATWIQSKSLIPMRSPDFDGSNTQKELDQQQQVNVDCEYLSQKLQHLEQIREGYTEEKEAWERNIEFFKNPLTLTTVSMRDCAFEHLNDTATLSSAYEHVQQKFVSEG